MVAQLISLIMYMPVQLARSSYVHVYKKNYIILLITLKYELIIFSIVHY